MTNEFFDELRRIKERNPRYIPPMPKKKQRCSHYRGKNKKVKIYSEEEIMLENMRRFPKHLLKLWR